MLTGFIPMNEWPGLLIAGRIGSGFVSHLLCSETFVSGIDPAETYRAFIAPNRFLGPLGFAIRYEVDRSRKEVRAKIAALFESRARYAGEAGCRIVRDPADEAIVDTLLRQSQPEKFDGAELAIVAPDDRLAAALEKAFEEPESGPRLLTRAVVVMRDGKIIGERYAPGVAAETPLLGFSLTKSVTNALIGVLVRRGRLRLQDFAPIERWRRGGDERAGITIDHLLRMQSGLSWYETLGEAGMDSASRMLWSEPDAVAFAESRPLEYAPGGYWRYSSGDTMLLSQIIHQAAGGGLLDSQRFAREALFEPLGMLAARFALDRRGAPIGAFGMFATARDWARFGDLYANDGVAGGVRLLPPGWVDYSATVTSEAPLGYGAHFWTMRSNTEDIIDWSMAGMPEDSLIAIGYFGQMIIISPSKRLVVVRLGVSYGGSSSVLPSLSPLLAVATSE